MNRLSWSFIVICLSMYSNFVRGILPIISVIFHKKFPWTPMSIGIRALRRAESDAWILASGTKDVHYQGFCEP